MTNFEAKPSLPPAILTAIRLIPECDQYFIGFSGGLDSLALIHFCVPYLQRFTSNITVIHVHHGLSDSADEWAGFCRNICQSAHLNCVVERVQVVSDGRGLEAAARQARYQVYARYLKNGGVLLLGHHMNDQAETLLMRFLKGLGPSALRGIPRQREFSGGLIFRPWLSIRREMLQSAMSQLTSSWVEDESNHDRRFERNFIRHEILPLLEQRRPSVLNDLQHAAARSAEYVEFITQWCRQHEPQFLSVEYGLARALDLGKLKTFDALQQKFILRYWFDLLGVEQPGDQNFQRLIEDLVQTESADKAEVIWKRHCVRCFNGSLFCFNAKDLALRPYQQCIQLDTLLEKPGSIQLELPAGVLTVSTVEKEEVCDSSRHEYLYHYSLICSIPAHVKHLVIRSRCPGDKIQLNPDYPQTLKKLLQNRRILPWHRDHLPVIALDQRTSDASEMISVSSLCASLCGVVSIPCRYDPERPGVDAMILRFTYETASGLIVKAS
jgi:tRNA(Ile)-lysidine synthase